MRRSHIRLQTKLLLTTLGFLLLLVVAVGWLVTAGFRATQENAARQSVGGLDAQGRKALRVLVEREGQVTSNYIQLPSRSTRMAAEFLGSLKTGHDADTMPFPRLTRHSDGHSFDASPNRRSDLFVPSFLSPTDPETLRNVRDSAALDNLVPSILELNPQAVAAYYVSTQPITRYYPSHTLEGNTPGDINVTKEPWYEPTAPAANPRRLTTWSPLYLDGAGHGLMLTTCTPVYEGDIFRGVFCIDVTLGTMIEHMNTLKLTPNTFAFLADNKGRIIVGPPQMIKALTGFDTIPIPEDRTQPIGLTLRDPALRAFVEQGKTDVDTFTINGESMFMTMAELPDLGWRLVVAAPIAEVTEQSQTVAAAIEQGTAVTFRSTIITLSVFFVLALIAVFAFSTRLVRPITALVDGTRKVAGGDLDTTINITSRDEIGALATSFNRMTEQLKVQHGTSERARVAAIEANRAKTQFLANMSHELRTPLTAIIGYSDLLQWQLEEGEAIPAEFIESIRSAGSHLQALINDILDLSKIEAGKMDLDLCQFRLEPLIAEVVATIQPLCDKNDNTIVVDKRYTEWAYSDITKLRQILLNLMSNACKFTKDGQIILMIDRTSQNGRDWLTCSVQDTGIGMTPEQVANLFQAFTQADTSTTRKYGGTGLGLALSRRLSLLLGGDITVQSEVECGSTFTVTLPLIMDGAPEPHVHEFEPSASNVLSAKDQGDIWRDSLVLLIDDDPAVRDVMTGYLASTGLIVDASASGEDGLAKARTTRPDVIILDVQMPGMVGWDVLAALKADAATADIPVIMLTVADFREYAMQHGAVNYLVKPINQSHLITVLGNVLQERAAPSTGAGPT